jgi:hypothetical protein
MAVSVRMEEVHRNTSRKIHTAGHAHPTCPQSILPNMLQKFTILTIECLLRKKKERI